MKAEINFENTFEKDKGYSLSLFPFIAIETSNSYDRNYYAVVLGFLFWYCEINWNTEIVEDKLKKESDDNK